MKIHPYQQNILKQTEFVKEHAKHVHINRKKLLELAQNILAHPDDINREWTELDFKYHFTDGDEQTAQWIFISSTLNFSFWEGEAEEKWQVEYEGEWVCGYWALTASLKKAMDTYHLLDATFLEQITPEILSDIFEGKGHPPLLEKRAQVCNRIGKTLKENFDGQFANVIKAAEGSAIKLTNLVANHFEDFKDVSLYEDQEVPLLKRAQILVADLWGALKGRGLGHFNDLDKLTIFADYKLPQFLRAVGVLEYSPELAEKIDTFQILEQGSPMEVEIRALTIQTVEELRQHIGDIYNAIQLDWWLWHTSFKGEYETKPHHLTRSVYY